MNLVNSDLHDRMLASDLDQVLVKHHNLELMVLQIRIDLLAICLFHYLLHDHIDVELLPQLNNTVVDVFDLVV